MEDAVLKYLNKIKISIKTLKISDRAKGPSYHTDKRSNSQWFKENIGQRWKINIFSLFRASS